MKSKKSHNFLLKGTFALIVGFINGFFGGGGGLVCVPTLERIYKLPTKKAHATTILIMLPLSIISSIIYIINNNFNYAVTFSITAGVLIGGFLGAVLLKKIKGSVIRWIFIIILFSAGVRMVV
ncbi:MAG: sulfite exporter TauE/SafE family protein [Clostridia bacterium]|nr:sulfite exporter TauE/SafE family protein [Clostridia bacterium]